MVQKYLKNKKIPFMTKPAEGVEYSELANKFGFTVPLVFNGKDGMVGFNIAKLNTLIAGDTYGASL